MVPTDLSPPNELGRERERERERETETEREREREREEWRPCVVHLPSGAVHGAPPPSVGTKTTM
jgi:hypothetical protein